MELDKLQSLTSILKDIWKDLIFPRLSFMDKQCLLSALNIKPETDFAKYKKEWFVPTLSHEDKENFIFRLYEICILWDVESNNKSQYDKKHDKDIEAIFREIIPPKFDYPCLVAFEEIAKLVTKNSKEDVVVKYKPCNAYSNMFHKKIPYAIQLFERFDKSEEYYRWRSEYIRNNMDIEFFRFLVGKDTSGTICQYFTLDFIFSTWKRIKEGGDRIEGKSQEELDQICREMYTTILTKNRKFVYKNRYSYERDRAHKVPNEIFGIKPKIDGCILITGGRDINKLTEALQWLRNCGDYPNSECALDDCTFEEIKLYIDCDGIVDTRFLEKISKNKISYGCIKYLYSIRKQIIIDGEYYKKWGSIICDLLKTCPKNINNAITMIHEMGFKKNGFAFHTLISYVSDAIPILVENHFEFPFKRNSYTSIRSLVEGDNDLKSENDYNKIMKILVECDLMDPDPHSKNPDTNSQRVFTLDI